MLQPLIKSTETTDTSNFICPAKNTFIKRKTENSLICCLFDNEASDAFIDLTSKRM